MLDERHVTIDAHVAREVSVLGLFPLERRAVIAMARRARLDRPDARIECGLALWAAREAAVVLPFLPVAGHARVAFLEIVVTADRILIDAGLEDRARRVADDAVGLAEAPGREPRFLVRERASVRVLLVLGVRVGMASNAVAAGHHFLLVGHASTRRAGIGHGAHPRPF